MNKEEMERALRVYFQPGDVFEVRVLDASTHDYRRPHIESGYFDYDHIGDIAKGLGHIQSYRGVYVTANPVEPELLSRAVNRVRAPGRKPTTSDLDIVTRRWLLIDCDAVRKSDIPSSDSEHKAAQEKAIEVKEGLASLNWPEPIVIDSGNGAQLMYRIDLPAEDSELIHKVLQGINLASSEAVNIDLTVFNAARIWRLPGTLNCKGDHTEARPHRMAKIISVPDKIELVTEEQLRGIVSCVEEESVQDTTYSTYTQGSSSFNLDEWISTYCPELAGQEATWKDGRKWVFDVCPFSAEHADRSAVITQHSAGGIAFKCHHNGCINNDWKALRELREPNYESKGVPVIAPGIDLSKFMVGKPVVSSDEDILAEEEEEKETKAVWRKITTEDVEKAIAGTLLGELTEIYSSVTKPKLPIEAALLKAVVTLGCCLSGEASQEELNKRFSGGNLASVLPSGIHRAKLKINTGGGQGNNVYAILAGNPASGKDIGNLIDDFSDFQNPSAKTDQFGGGGNYLIGTGGSAEGIADALITKPNGLILISELRDWLDEKHWQHNATSFLTQAFNKAKFSATFSSRGGKNGSRKCDYCLPSILANIQPQTFERLATVANIETGFLSRFLFAKMPKFFGDATRFDPVEKLSRIKEITDIFAKKHGVVEVPEDYTLELKEIFRNNNNERLDASWRRLSNEYYPRLAVQLSVTMSTKTHGESVILTDDCWARARVLVLWFFANAEKMLLGVNEDSPFVREREARFKKIFQLIERLHKKYKKPVTLRMIGRNGFSFNNMKTTAKERQEAIMELIACGVIELTGDGYTPKETPEGWE